MALIKTLEAHGFGVFLLAPDDAYSLRLSAESEARFSALKHLSRRSFSPLKNLRLFFELRRHFQRHAPEVVLLYTLKANILGNLAAASLRIPAISVVEGMGYGATAPRGLRFLVRLLYWLSLRFAQKVVFLNADDLREMRRQGLVAERQAILIHGPGIDLQHFLPQAKPALQHPVFLFVGRLLREKGLREFVEAARHLRQQGVEAEFRVLGSPDPENPTSITPEELAQWQTEGTVQFLGHTDDVRPAIAAADAVVLPSFYREGVPRALLEGMAMGKIIITTDAPGCRDTLEEGENGFFTIPRDAAALAQAILKMLALSPGQRAAFGRRSREKVEREFGDAMVLPQYLDIIDAVQKQAGEN